MSKSRKGLKKIGMRSYRVDGPKDSYIITRDAPWRFLVRNARSPVLFADFFALKFKRLKAARAWAEREAGVAEG